MSVLDDLGKANAGVLRVDAGRSCWRSLFCFWRPSADEYWPDIVVLYATGDVYEQAVAYRAAAFLTLVGDSADPTFDTLEAQARDADVGQIPLALVIRAGAVGH